MLYSYNAYVVAEQSPQEALSHRQICDPRLEPKRRIKALHPDTSGIHLSPIGPITLDVYRVYSRYTCFLLLEL